MYPVVQFAFVYTLCLVLICFPASGDTDSDKAMYDDLSISIQPHPVPPTITPSSDIELDDNRKGISYSPINNGDNYNAVKKSKKYEKNFDINNRKKETKKKKK